MSDKEKIEAIIADKHLNNSQFCSKIAISPGTLSHIRSGRTEPTLNILRCISIAFPDINPMWLFSDEGPMYSENAGSASADEVVDTSSEDGALSAEAGLDLFGYPSQQARTSAKVAVNERDLYGANTVRDKHPQAGAPVVALTTPAVSVQDIVTETLKQQQKPQRKIVEVRIFFDDGTFETFGSK